jgi:hypothetical protein
MLERVDEWRLGERDAGQLSGEFGAVTVSRRVHCDQCRVTVIYSRLKRILSVCSSFAITEWFHFCPHLQARRRSPPPTRYVEIFYLESSFVRMSVVISSANILGARARQRWLSTLLWPLG